VFWFDGIIIVLPISSHSTEVSAIAMYNVHGHKLCSQAVEETALEI